MSYKVENKVHIKRSFLQNHESNKNCIEDLSAFSKWGIEGKYNQEPIHSIQPCLGKG